LVKIRLKRMGTNKKPYFRIVVADARSPRDGRFIEQVGIYHPISIQGKQLSYDRERIKKWVLEGAQATDVVRKLLNKENFRFDRDLLAKE